MNWQHVWNRLTGRASREEAAFDEEVAFHQAMKARELEQAGLEPQAAHDAARRAVGNVTLAREEVREAWSFRWLTDALQDLRYGVRGLLAQPGFTAAAVLALVLGIGVNAIVFNVYNALALAPFAVRDAQRGVMVWSERGMSWGGVSWPEFRYLRQHTRMLSGLVATTNTGLRIGRPGAPAWNGEAAAVSENYFDVLGTGFVYGRGFTSEAGALRDPAPEMVLHHDTWVARFGADPSIVGQWLEVNGRQLQVVGIAAQGFSGPSPTSPVAWIPGAWRDLLDAGGRTYDNASNCCVVLAGHLQAGRTHDAAVAELTALSAQFRRSVSQETGRVRVTPMTLLSNPKAQAEGTALFVALGVTALLILLLACANVANLQIARALARRREISVRLALGAGRGRVLRQMLAESLLIASVAGAAGLALAAWAPGRLVQYIAESERSIALRFDNDYRVVAFILGVTLLAAVASGLAPAWHAVRDGVAVGLRDARALAAGGRLRRVLLAAQVALSAILVSGATLLVRVADHARTADPGFVHEQVINLNAGLIASGAHDEQTRALMAELIERIEALPAVESVARSVAVPLGNTSMTWGGLKDGRGGSFSMGMDRVSPNFFTTLRIPLRAGPGLQPDDDQREVSAVINQAAADQLWPGGNPIGQPIQPDSKIIVVGVAPNVVTRSFGTEHKPHMWLAARPSREAKLLIRHKPGARDTLLAALPGLARQLDKRFYPSVVTLSDTVASGLRMVHVAAGIAGVLGLLSLLLACVGIYGVAAYNVSQRTREIGVRMALGARPSGILGMVLGQNLRTVAVGVAVGIVGALGFARLLKNLLYGVSPSDPVALAASLCLLTITAVLATWAPAQRASAIDPSLTLREE